MTADPDDLFRVYTPEECGADGYPTAWHRLTHDQLMDWSSGIGVQHYPPGVTMGVKDLVRAEADHRCLRCHHPYGGPPGYGDRGEWTPCDDRCAHDGPVRYLTTEGGGEPRWHEEPSKLMGWTTGDLWRDSPQTAEQARPEARWRILTVHHLRTGAEAKRDLRWWNLVALCQRCHLTIQGKVQMDRVWPWEHSAWFKPYVAGFYAWRYLGEELTRHQTMQRLDDLLALERVA